MEFLRITKRAIKADSGKQYARAFNLFQDAIKLTENTPAIIRIMGRQAWCLHFVWNHEDALALVNRILEEYPEHPVGYLINASFFVKINRAKTAKSILKKGLEKFPDQLELYLTLASILKDTERSNEAIDVLKRALSHEKLSRGRGIERRDIWAELGSLYFERGDYNSSIACFKKGMRMGSEENFLHFDILALCYLKLNDSKNSLKYIDLHLHYFGDHYPEDFIIKARAHAKLGELPLATSNILHAYSFENSINLSSEDMIDFAPLIQSGFFNTLDKVDIDEI
ncbi:MAG: tetratricopeptide repeat protein [Leptospira sp.]|nr:tetratricopeptide repeat protein [Leptospira sp.]